MRVMQLAGRGKQLEMAERQRGCLGTGQILLRVLACNAAVLVTRPA